MIFLPVPTVVGGNDFTSDVMVRILFLYKLRVSRDAIELTCIVHPSVFYHLFYMCCVPFVAKLIFDVIVVKIKKDKKKK